LLDAPAAALLIIVSDTVSAITRREEKATEANRVKRVDVFMLKRQDENRKGGKAGNGGNVENVPHGQKTL